MTCQPVRSAQSDGAGGIPSLPHLVSRLGEQQLAETAPRDPNCDQSVHKTLEQSHLYVENQRFVIEFSNPSRKEPPKDLSKTTLTIAKKGREKSNYLF